MRNAGSLHRRICKVILVVFLVLWLIALTLFLVGTIGLFGSERDPLAGVFLVPLGLPWNRATDVFPEQLWPWLAALTPLVNAAALAVACRVLSRR